MNLKPGLLCFGRGEQIELDTINIVLMIILSVMIGFAIGNVYGRASMKQIMTDLLNQMIDGAKKSSITAQRTKGE